MDKRKFIVQKNNLSTVKLSCICARGRENEEYVVCNTCSTHQHLSCVTEPYKMWTYECPYCQIKNFNYFFLNLDIIMPPKLILHSTKDAEYSFTFMITDNQRDILNNAPDGTLRCLIVRCIRLDSKGYEHHWPMNSTIEIYENMSNWGGGKNTVAAQTFVWKKTPPRAHPRVDYPLCFEVKNDKCDKSYHFYLKDNFDDVAKIKTNKDYIIRLKNQYLLNSDDKYSYSLSMDIVEINKDVDKVINKAKKYSEPTQLKLLMKKTDDLGLYEKVSFICQYKASRIMIPGRGHDCLHLQVLNDLNYIGV